MGRNLSLALSTLCMIMQNDCCFSRATSQTREGTIPLFLIDCRKSSYPLGMGLDFLKKRLTVWMMLSRKGIIKKGTIQIHQISHSHESGNPEPHQPYWKQELPKQTAMHQSNYTPNQPD